MNSDSKKRFRSRWNPHLKYFAKRGRIWLAAFVVLLAVGSVSEAIAGGYTVGADTGPWANSATAVQDSAGDTFWFSSGAIYEHYAGQPNSAFVTVGTALTDSDFATFAIDCEIPPNIYAIQLGNHTSSITKIQPGGDTFGTPLVSNDPGLANAKKIIVNCPSNVFYTTDLNGGTINSYDLNTGAKQVVASGLGSVDDLATTVFLNGLAFSVANLDGTHNIGLLATDTGQSRTVLSGINNFQTFASFGLSSNSFQIVVNPSNTWNFFPTGTPASISNVQPFTGSTPTTFAMNQWYLAPSSRDPSRTFAYPALNPSALSLGFATQGPVDLNISRQDRAAFMVRAFFIDPFFGGVYLLPFQITTPPPYTTSYIGMNPSLAVGASPVFANQPLYYQWSQNGVPIAGATNSAITFSNVQPANAGIYFVRVSLTPGDKGDDTLLADGGLTVLSPYNFSPVTTGDYNGAAAGKIGTNAGVFLADTVFSRILFIDTNNNATTIGGTLGGFGYADGTNMTSRFATPQGLAIDSSTNIYVADTGNHLIRVIQPVGTNWVTSTVAGHYQTNGSGLAIGGYGDGIGTNALFSHPFCVAVDSMTNIYVGDSDSNVVRKITKVGTNWMVSTLAGKPGVAGYLNAVGTNVMFNGLYGVAADAVGDVFVADRNNNVVREIAPDGTTATIAGLRGSVGSAPGTDGVSSAARFSSPDAIALACDGSLFVADSGFGSIRKMVQQGSNWMVFTVGYGQFIQPRAIATDCSGVLYISDIGLYSKGSNSVLRAVPGVNPPAITAPPSTQTQVSGGRATLSVTVSNTSPVSYQWLSNGIAIAGQTNTSLTLSNLTRGNQGVYQVVVSGTNGALVSSSTLLRVLVPPLLQPPMLHGPNGYPTVLFLGADGGLPDDLSLVNVQWRTNLPSGADTNWQSLSSAAYITTNGLVGMDDTNAPGVTRYYRVMQH